MDLAWSLRERLFLLHKRGNLQNDPSPASPRCGERFPFPKREWAGVGSNAYILLVFVKLEYYNIIMKLCIILLLALPLIGCATTPNKRTSVILAQTIPNTVISFSFYMDKLHELDADIKHQYENDTCFTKIEQQVDSLLWAHQYKYGWTVRKYTGWEFPVIVIGSLIYIVRHPGDPSVAVLSGLFYSGTIILNAIVAKAITPTKITQNDINELNSLVVEYNQTVMRNYYKPDVPQEK